MLLFLGEEDDLALELLHGGVGDLADVDVVLEVLNRHGFHWVQERQRLGKEQAHLVSHFLGGTPAFPSQEESP